MEEIRTIKPIAYIRCGFIEKFGIPRQSGLVEEVKARIEFELEYRSEEAIRGLEGYSHIWLIWGFLGTDRETNSLTVRPPRLGGNIRMGVFATRSPFRPNALGLSSVRLCEIVQEGACAPALIVSGADLMDNTPIYDIKPYLAFTDSHPDALGGFATGVEKYSVRVEFEETLKAQLSKEKQDVLLGILSQDPRPSYQNDPERVYGLTYGDMEVKFRVDNGTLYVTEIKTK